MRLLILPCSASKRTDPAPLPADQRYTGSWSKVLAAWSREHPDQRTETDVYFLSARFGLIRADEPIPWYEQRMTPARAAELAPSIGNAVNKLIAKPYSKACISLGQLYWRALGNVLINPQMPLLITGGRGIGDHLQQRKRWLEQSPGPS